MKHTVKRIHFVGIGGSGMSGIAEVLANQGYEVSGSDLGASATTQRLAERGIRVAIGHAAENVATADAVVVSTAVKLVVHVAMFPPRSVTVTSTACVPRPTSVPASGDWLIENPQLSVADVAAAKLGTGARQLALTEPVCAGAQLVITGGIVSVPLITVADVEAVDPFESVTVTE